MTDPHTLPPPETVQQQQQQQLKADSVAFDPSLLLQSNNPFTENSLTPSQSFPQSSQLESNLAFLENIVSQYENSPNSQEKFPEITPVPKSHTDQSKSIRTLQSYIGNASNGQSKTPMKTNIDHIHEIVLKTLKKAPKIRKYRKQLSQARIRAIDEFTAKIDCFANHSNWIQKYKPQHIHELISDNDSNFMLLEWLVHWKRYLVQNWPIHPFVQNTQSLKEIDQPDFPVREKPINSQMPQKDSKTLRNADTLPDAQSLNFSIPESKYDFLHHDKQNLLAMDQSEDEFSSSMPSASVDSNLLFSTDFFQNVQNQPDFFKVVPLDQQNLVYYTNESFGPKDSPQKWDYHHSPKNQEPNTKEMIENTKRPWYGGLIVNGPCGSGKKTMIEIIAKHCNFSLITVDQQKVAQMVADEPNNKHLVLSNYIQRIAESSLSESFGPRKHVIIFLPHIDMWFQSQSLKFKCNACNQLKKLSKTLAVPLIISTQNQWLPQLKGIVSWWKRLNLKPPNKEKAIPRFLSILKQENRTGPLLIVQKAVSMLYDSSNHDFRSTLLHIEFFSMTPTLVTTMHESQSLEQSIQESTNDSFLKNTPILVSQEWYDCIIHTKDIISTPFSCWEKIFVRDSEISLAQSLEPLGKYFNYDLILQGCFENCYSYHSPIDPICKTSSKLMEYISNWTVPWLSIAKEKQILMHQYFPFIFSPIISILSVTESQHKRWKTAAAFSRKAFYQNAPQTIVQMKSTYSQKPVSPHFQYPTWYKLLSQDILTFRGKLSMWQNLIKNKPIKFLVAPYSKDWTNFIEQIQYIASILTNVLANIRSTSFTSFNLFSKNEKKSFVYACILSWSYGIKPVLQVQKTSDSKFIGGIEHLVTFPSFPNQSVIFNDSVSISGYSRILNFFANPIRVVCQFLPDESQSIVGQLFSNSSTVENLKNIPSTMIKSHNNSPAYNFSQHSPNSSPIRKKTVPKVRRGFDLLSMGFKKHTIEASNSNENPNLNHLLSSPINYVFHEGFTNAVRKPVTYADFY